MIAVNYTPQTAQDHIYDLVMDILARKRLLKIAPSHVLLSEIIPLSPFREQEVCDLLSQLIMQGRLLSGPTINDTYYKANI